MRDFLVERLGRRLTGERIDQMFDEQVWHDETGTPIPLDAPYQPHRFIWFHRDLPDETPLPWEPVVLHRDERLVVVDKPHFMASIPRGNHIQQTVVVKLRQSLDLPELGPAHRLDRNTAGVLLCTTERRWRGAYQEVFTHRGVAKRYLAVAAARDDLLEPAEVRSHIVKERGNLQAIQRQDVEPNAHTTVRLLERRGDLGLYEAIPHTGRTHQIRLHLHLLGIPIINDPLYPEVLDVSIHDFSAPLQLLAAELSFTDPVEATPRLFRSARSLAVWDEASG
ncbi:pseudouridine synthase [Aestuariimicrobium ganziense]|uniref:pseudouridine synthase n=1 Tax=Aestuariimicrobium ganziense TaxID=2773677 RepID=UPI0019403FEE|nr:pseudouridine synthase [Aestuariimicrobium ganziense]